VNRVESHRNTDQQGETPYREHKDRHVAEEESPSEGEGLGGSGKEMATQRGNASEKGTNSRFVKPKFCFAGEHKNRAGSGGVSQQYTIKRNVRAAAFLS